MIQGGNPPIASVLLAAGRGERLRPLTDRVGKAALPLLDVPLGAFGLSSLASAVPPVVVNVHHLGAPVSEALRPYASGAMEGLVEEPEPYGTAGTLAALRGRVRERVVCWNADALVDLNPRELISAHASTGAEATIAIVPVQSGADVRVEGSRVVELWDGHGSAPGGLYIGIAVFEQEALESIGETRPVGIFEALLRPLAERGKLAVVAHPGYALDVGTPSRFLQASLDVLEGGGPRPPGGRWPGEIVEVEGGRAYIGPGARVGGVLEPGAVVLADAVVEPGARIHRAIVWPGERVGAGTEVANAIWPLEDRKSVV